MVAQPMPVALEDRGRPGRLRSVLLSAAAVVVCAVLAARGITVVPDAEVASTDLAGNPNFDAHAYVDSIWGSRVVPLAQDHATDIVTVLDALATNVDAAGARYGHRPANGDGPWNFLVRGEGVIKQASTQLRHATLTVDVGGGHDVVLQIGPVVFGTALRDSLPFVSFDQVVNQIQFAQISREMNDRATAATRSGLDVAKLTPGTKIAFAGAMPDGQPAQVTVMRLRVLGTP